MQKPQSWRDLLKELIRDAQVRQKIITELEINPITLNRWIQGESKPRTRSLRRLLSILSEHREILQPLIEEEFEDFAAETREDAMQNMSLTIPAEFYKRVLHTLSAIPPALVSRRFAISFCNRQLNNLTLMDKALLLLSQAACRHLLCKRYVAYVSERVEVLRRGLAT